MTEVVWSHWKAGLNLASYFLKFLFKFYFLFLQQQHNKKYSFSLIKRNPEYIISHFTNVPTGCKMSPPLKHLLFCYACALQVPCVSLLIGMSSFILKARTLLYEGVFNRDAEHLSHVVFQECPSGIVNEDTFKDIYAQFFPQGGSCHVSLPLCFCRLCCCFSSNAVCNDADCFSLYKKEKLHHVQSTFM